MRTFKLILAYDGANYSGWQFQPDRPTVQGTLEAALAKILGRPVRVLASGRTDAGVHALGQVVGFQAETALPLEELQRALNAHLPHDVAVRSLVEAPEGFHPTTHAVRKRYRYVIYDGPVRNVFARQYSWHFRHGRLDEKSMHRAAAALLGTHDFSSFETRGAERQTSVRTIFEISVRRSRAGEGGWQAGLPPGSVGGDDWLIIEVEADGFLYNMVRAIVGTLVEVGRGAKPESFPAEALHAADRRAAGPTAPPQGLFLVRVDYD
jgi:tRNA pseudouridine38-40 synthase